MSKTDDKIKSLNIKKNKIDDFNNVPDLIR